MRHIAFRILWLGTALIACLCGGILTLGAAPAGNPPKQPKTDVLDRFDEEQSPLQKGILDARDKKWRGKAKLGADPRCARVVREFAREEGKPSPSHPKSCFDPAGNPLPKEECLSLYCCEQPGAVTCPEVACAMALIDGIDLSACFEQPLSSDPCLEEIFKKAGQPRVIDCLEDPLDEDNEIRPKCRGLFEACTAMPLVRSEKDAARSGKIQDQQGRQIGRRVQSRTVIHYDLAGQRGPAGTEALAAESWDAIRIRPSRSEQQSQAVPGETQRVDRMLSASSFNSGCDPLFRCPENDDGDCLDRVTGTHHGSEECFDENGRLRVTLTATTDDCPDGALCCKHTGLASQPGTGEVFYDDDCTNGPEVEDDPEGLRTTLVQMIDEDPFDSLNNDGDCTNGSFVTSDCLDSNGNLRTGFLWNVDEEARNGLNEDNDCLGSGGRIGSLQGSRCVDARGGTIGEAKDVDFIEQIDEDCPESTSAADLVDNDQDGLFGEDPPGIKISSSSTSAPAGPAPAVRSPVGVNGHGRLLRDSPGDREARRTTGLATEDDRACRDFYAMVGQQAGVDLEPTSEELSGAGSGCDLTRAMRVHANWSLRQPRNQENFEKLKARSGKEKLFDVDSHGRWCGDPGTDPCDPDDSKRGSVHPGNTHDPRNKSGNGKRYRYEERRATVDEVFAVKCKPVKDGSGQWIPTRYDDATGTCARVDGVSQAAYKMALAGAADGTCTSEACLQAMMGFTFAPPVLEWGWRVKEEVCIFGFCFEIFYARIGYEFDLAAGVRLPVEVQFDGAPDSILAARQLPVIQTSLQPLDFSTDQFSAFCEAHGLDRPWYIANCGDRFAFPDFLDAQDGDEFVAQYSIFAGIIVRLFYIPLINFSIDSGVDVPAMCTVWKMKDGIEGMSMADMIKLQLGLLQDGDVLQTLKDNFGNCGSFTTPFGFEPCDPSDPTSCPPTGKRLRAWPFLNLSKWIRADCFDAVRNGEVVTVKGKTIPICTGLILGTSGASLGVGLGVEASAGSLLIKADWSASGDSAATGGTLGYETSADDPSPGDRKQTLPISGITADNYADKHPGGTTYEDHAVVGLDDFTYFLNTIELTLSAKLEFGGILSPIPDIASFRLYSFVFDTTSAGWDGIPIPQHPDTGPVKLEISVANYGLDVAVGPGDPPATEPGCGLGTVTTGSCPGHDVWVTNIGSLPDSFDNFRIELSNRPTHPGCSSEFRIDPNNDTDCLVAGAWHRGNPYDNVSDECYDECGRPLPGSVEIINEDPPGCLDPSSPCNSPRDRDDDGDGYVDEDGPGEDWSAAWFQGDQNVPLPSVGDVTAHTRAPEPVVLRVSPLRHPLTRPGVYPFRVKADSVGARANALPAQDPMGKHRKDAYVDGALEAVSFFDPQIQAVPATSQLPPGIARTYRVDVRNGSNQEDSMEVLTRFLDFNQAGCTLVTLGSLPGCPYRAVPTAVPESWLVGAPPGAFGPLDPAEPASSSFGVSVPGTWAGLQDTTYRIELTASSTGDPAEPPAHNAFVIEHTVKATLESRTRYIGLEIEELISEIERANALGIRTAGLLPIFRHPVQTGHQRAMDRILSGDSRGAVQALKTVIHTTEAFLQALEGSGGNGKIPEPFMSDWRLRAQTIVVDLNRTVSPDPSPQPAQGPAPRTKPSSLRLK